MMNIVDVRRQLMNRTFAKEKDIFETLFRSMSTSTCKGQMPTKQGALSKTIKRGNNYSPDSETYIDEWFSSIVKPEKFYEKHAAIGKKEKIYFYSIDLQGRVFLEETLPKNVATSIKNEKFLDFLYKNLQRLGPKEESILESIGVKSKGDEYPFVSKCGIELNFVRPADNPIVFHTLQKDKNQWFFQYGGTLLQSFSPNKLYLSKRTGRLYHQLNLRDQNCQKETEQMFDKMTDMTPLHRSTTRNEFGLIKSSVAVEISDRIFHFEDKQSFKDHDALLRHEVEQCSGFHFNCPYTEQSLPIAFLPIHAEPIPWGMPIFFFDE